MSKGGGATLAEALWLTAMNMVTQNNPNSIFTAQRVDMVITASFPNGTMMINSRSSISYH
jgi:hypothetical protein